MKRLTGILLLLGCLALTTHLAQGGDPPSNKAKGTDLTTGGPKGMALHEKARLGNEEMGPVVMDEEPVVPPGEEPPSDMPPEDEAPPTDTGKGKAPTAAPKR
ncbi:MAG: hypothetical protein BWK76_03795 [Desulfobulbaceae bacterium A2]|nr:MAG: hypothetical protein BWK76_03795 [Desulfobulbaceae bacterium A2]